MGIPRGGDMPASYFSPRTAQTKAWFGTAISDLLAPLWFDCAGTCVSTLSYVRESTVRGDGRRTSSRDPRMGELAGAMSVRWLVLA